MNTERKELVEIPVPARRQEIKPGVEIVITPDFPPEDPWSRGMRDVLSRRIDRFAGRKLTEFGIGDARNERHILKGLSEKGLSAPTAIIGVELDKWRGDIASYNLTEEAVGHEIVHKDAVQWLDEFSGNEKLDGNALLCLPQAPLSGAENHADGYSEKDLPENVQKWNKYGLGLNAAVLSSLASKAEEDFRAFAMFSGRVPKDVLSDMFAETGWDIIARHDAGIAQQDPDTSVAYTIPFDTLADRGEALFYTKANGKSVPITAEIAEKEREVSELSGKGREALNVFHELAVYELRPKQNERVIYAATT